MAEAVQSGSDRHCAGFDPVPELSTGFWEGGGLRARMKADSILVCVDL